MNNTLPSKYYDFSGYGTSLPDDITLSDFKNKPIGEIKRYWWICYVEYVNCNPRFYHTTLCNEHPIAWAKRNESALLNYKEITEEEYEMF